MCKVPGARDVPWIRLKTKTQFYRAHAARLVRDLPETCRFEVIGPTLNAHHLFKKLAKVNPGTKSRGVAFIETLPLENGVDHMTALHRALDISGRKDSVAGLKGPDEIIFLGGTAPWRADVTDEDEIGGAIGLKARMRMVPIHTVGVGSHPYVMMRAISKESGGTYVDLSR